MNLRMLVGMSLALLLAFALPAAATVVSTSGLTIITPAPGTVITANFIINNGLPSQMIFDERQGVTLTAPLTTDTGVIPAGTVVDSAFFAVNSVTTVVANTSATFDGRVLGVVYLDGSPHYATSDFLGLSTLVYNESCSLCGFEAGDTATIVGNTVDFHNSYSEPGDFARIITAATPEPGTLVMFGTGVVGLAGLLRRKFNV